MNRIVMSIIAAASLLLSIALFASAASGPKVSASGNKHNLSFSNSGVTYKASDSSDPRSSQICIFCHTPHNARTNTALWNRNDTTQSFGHYSSPSLKLHTDPTLKTSSDYKSEPNGSSRLCLSCHDGVTALGAIVASSLGTTTIQVSGGAGNGTLSASSTKFDRNKMTNSHHPVSFKYNAAVVARLKILENPANDYWLPADAPSQDSPGSPGTNKAKQFVPLDREQRMQCTTCHDPHQTQFDGSSLTPFWVFGGSGLTTIDAGTVHDEVCLACHSFKAPDL